MRMLDHRARRPRDEAFLAAHPERLARERQIDSSASCAWAGYRSRGRASGSRRRPSRFRSDRAGRPIPSSRSVRELGTEIDRRKGLPPFKVSAAATKSAPARGSRARRAARGSRASDRPKSTELRRAGRWEVGPIREKGRGGGHRRQLKLRRAGERLDARGLISVRESMHLPSWLVSTGLRPTSLNETVGAAPRPCPSWPGLSQGLSQPSTSARRSGLRCAVRDQSAKPWGLDQVGHVDGGTGPAMTEDGMESGTYRFASRMG